MENKNIYVVLQNSNNEEIQLVHDHSEYLKNEDLESYVKEILELILTINTDGLTEDLTNRIKEIRAKMVSLKEIKLSGEQIRELNTIIMSIIDESIDIPELSEALIKYEELRIKVESMEDGDGESEDIVINLDDLLLETEKLEGLTVSKPDYFQFTRLMKQRETKRDALLKLYKKPEVIE